ncbi:hypothetical protein D3C85_1661530 [compost metagenome]
MSGLGFWRATAVDAQCRIIPTAKIVFEIQIFEMLIFTSVNPLGNCPKFFLFVLRLMPDSHKLVYSEGFYMAKNLIK